MRLIGGALAVVAGCSAPLPTSPAAPAPALASSAAPVVAEPELPPPPAPPPEIAYEGARAERLVSLTRTALGVVDAFANVSPQPVVRGYTEVPHVQFRTDRRDPGVLRWVESPTLALHHVVTDATKVEPCARPLVPGGEARLGDVVVRLVRGADHDEVRFGDEKKPITAKLPRGASHGACVGLEGTRLWISWSTPTTPPELFSLSRRDGSSRPLRIDSRPGLALLDDVRATEIEGVAAVLEPKHGAQATALVVEDDGAPLACWSPLVRFLADAGVKTLVTSRATLPAALALARTSGPVTIVLPRAMGLVAVQDPVVLVGESADAFDGVVPAGTTIVAAGPALADAARAAASRAGGKVAIAPGAKRRDAVAAAFARVADAVLPGL